MYRQRSRLAAAASPRRSTKAKAKAKVAAPAAASFTPAERTLRSIVRLQAAIRSRHAHKVAAAKRAERQEMLHALQDPRAATISLNGKRAKPWSDESAALAMAELRGYKDGKGMVMWPKGTVEKLLIERTKYSDIVAQSRRGN
jgi:hypothetical protein